MIIIRDDNEDSLVSSAFIFIVTAAAGNSKNVKMTFTNTQVQKVMFLSYYTIELLSYGN